MDTTADILSDTSGFLRFLKSRFPLIHLSNVFFRDLHYGVMEFLSRSGRKMTYTESEKVARRVAQELQQAGILKQIDHQSWLLNYPEFALPRVEKKAS